MSTENSFKVYSGIPAAKMNQALAVAKLNNLQLLSYTVTASDLDSKAVVNLAKLLPGQVIIQASAVVNDAFTLADEATVTVGLANSASADPTGATLLDEKQTTFALNQAFNDTNNAPYVVQAATAFLNVQVNDVSTTASADGTFVVNLLVSNSAVNV